MECGHRPAIVFRVIADLLQIGDSESVVSIGVVRIELNGALRECEVGGDCLTRRHRDRALFWREAEESGAQPHTASGCGAKRVFARRVGSHAELRAVSFSDDLDLDASEWASSGSVGHESSDPACLRVCRATDEQISDFSSRRPKQSNTRSHLTPR